MLPFATLSFLQGFVYLWHNVIQTDTFDRWIRGTKAFRKEKWNSE
jgi:hypothetical protein